MKTLLLLGLLMPIIGQAQKTPLTDTIFATDGTVIPCKVTLDNGVYVFYNTKKRDGETIEKKSVSYYVEGTKKTIINKPEGRKGFEWDLVISDLPYPKSKLYSITKLFIAEQWKTPSEVIKNDDKEDGVILVKGLNVIESTYQLVNHRWAFNHSVTFMIKDNKCRIVISDVTCESAYASSNPWPLLQVGDKYPGFTSTSVTEEKYKEIMRELGDQLQELVWKYKETLNKPYKELNDW